MLRQGGNGEGGCLGRVGGNGEGGCLGRVGMVRVGA